MTQEEFDKAPLLDQILYDKTGMLVENHRDIAEAMEEYHQAKLKLLSIADVGSSLLAERIEECLAKYWYDTEYNLIDKTDHKKAEESRLIFRKWVDENLPVFSKL